MKFNNSEYFNNLTEEEKRKYLQNLTPEETIKYLEHANSGSINDYLTKAILQVLLKYGSEAPRLLGKVVENLKKHKLLNIKGGTLLSLIEIEHSSKNSENMIKRLKDQSNFDKQFSDLNSLIEFYLTYLATENELNRAYEQFTTPNPEADTHFSNVISDLESKMKNMELSDEGEPSTPPSSDMADLTTQMGSIELSGKTNYILDSLNDID